LCVRHGCGSSNSSSSRRQQQQQEQQKKQPAVHMHHPRAEPHWRVCGGAGGAGVLQGAAVL
jgi:hypothetical protein